MVDYKGLNTKMKKLARGKNIQKGCSLRQLLTIFAQHATHNDSRNKK